MIGQFVLRSATSADREALLGYDDAAAAAGNDFTYGDAALSRTVRSWLLDRGAAECGPPTASLLEVDGRVAGMLCVLSAAEVTRRRLLAALALRRPGAPDLPPAVGDRMRLVSATLLRCAPDDAYLSRIAVDPQFGGNGAGSWLLDRAVDAARALGAHRLVLDVAEGNVRARSLYHHRGFTELHRAAADDMTGAAAPRRICHLHLALDLAPA